MKTKISLIITILIVLGTFMNIFAQGPQKIDSVVEKDSLINAKEHTEVQKAIDLSPAKDILLKNKDELSIPELKSINTEDELSYGEPYKVVIANKELVNALLNGKNLSSILPDLPYYWEVPILLKENVEKSIGSFTVDYYNGGWNVAEIGGYLPKKEIVFSSRKDKILKSLRSELIEEANNYTHIRIPSLKADYLYLDTKDQEYFIKVNNSQSDKKVKQTREELFSDIGESLKYGLNAPKDSIGGIGSTTPVDKTTNALPITVGILIPVMMVCFTLVVGKKYRLAKYSVK